jgi:transposase-like protein
LRFGRTRVDCGVEEFTDVQCPYCGQNCELVIDTSLAKQRFNTDCEVCCRPFEVSAECEPGKILAVEVSAE